MRFLDGPAGFAWSSPFARWQGSARRCSGLELATVLTRRALADRGLSASQVDRARARWTVPQPDQFFGAPLLAGRIGAPGISGR
ncbi:hypothetical protein [uncultured Jatrophihabitans sp.]|uniref:hypothetical protein n=1 Tax=uncultured Jatrophihabitans sp. TaxID=1610747 RepID=UPI0035CB9CC1